MVAPLQYPLIGGIRHDFSSLELKFTGPTGALPRFKGFKSFGYTWKLTPTKLWGAHPDPIGQTLGVADYTCDIEVYLAEYVAWLASIGPGFATIPLTAEASYSSNGFDTIVDRILGCRLSSGEAAMSQGGDGLTRKLELSPLKVLPNGVDLLAQVLNGA
jgi:hypothetical protein